jgi:hypothetical protein
MFESTSQGKVLGNTTCATCSAGFFCEANALNVFGATNMTGMSTVETNRFVVFALT